MSMITLLTCFLSLCDPPPHEATISRHDIGSSSDRAHFAHSSIYPISTYKYISIYIYMVVDKKVEVQIIGTAAETVPPPI